MRIAKKVLSLILAFCMAFSVLSVAVFAEESPAVEDALASTGLRVTKADGSPLGDSLAPGDVVRCYIGWQTNYNWRVISNIVYYDTTVFVPCYPSGGSFVEQTAKCTGTTVVTTSKGVFHPLTADDFSEAPAAGIISENIGGYFSGQINNTLTSGLISSNFPPEMRHKEGKENVLNTEYANYNFVQASVSTASDRGTAEGFILDEYQEYVYFYMKVKDTAALNSQAGLFMHPGSTKGIGTIAEEKDYTGGKTSCSWMPSEAIEPATALSRATCTVLTGETYYSISNGAPAETFTVNFDLNGGTGAEAPEAVTGEAGTAVTLPATTATKQGYTFKGWAESATATEALTSYSITGNATLYAVWEKNPTYTVDFDLNGGSGNAPASVTGERGTVVTLPATVDAIKTGYTFKGWAESTTAAIPLTSYSITGNATLYAIWEKNATYTVTFDLNGGTGAEAPEAVTGEAGTVVTLPSTTAKKTGFTFKGWAESATATEALTSYSITGNATLYAVWTSNPTYTVAFDLNGATGTAPEAVTGEVGENVVLPATVDAAKEGCEFKGWGTSATSTYALTSYTIPSGGSTLYAIWGAKDYTITYKADGSADIVKTYKFGANTQAAPSVPAKTGYTGAWDKETPATMPAEDLVITAVYAPNKYTITYKVNGNVYDTDEVEYDTVVTIKAVPEVTGKIGSWVWTNVNGGAVSAPEKMPAYDLVATAEYTAIPVSYKVETYEMDTTGTYQLMTSETKTADANADVSITAPAAAAGFSIAGDMNVLSGNVGTVDNSLTLKIYYSRNQYTFNYVVEGADYTTQTYYYGARFAFPNAPTVEAPKSFKYWTLNGQQFNAPATVGDVNSPVTLVAYIDSGIVGPADYTALYAFLESTSVNPRNIGFQSFFPLLPAETGLSYLERAAEEIVHYKEPAKTAITNALSFRTDCTEDEQDIVDGYLAAAKNVFNTYIWHSKVDEEFDCVVTDPFGNTGTETAYRNPYTYEYYAENYNAELNIVQKSVEEDGTYVFDVVLSSNYPVATFGFPILINSEKFDIGTVPGTSSSYTTPDTDFFTRDGGFNAFYGYAQDGTSTIFSKHSTATATNKSTYPGRYPEGPGWSAYDDLAFRNKYSIEFLAMGITQSPKSAPLAMSYDNLVIATFAIKLKDGQEFDKNDTFMVGDYFIGNQKTGDYGVSRTLYTVAKSKNSMTSGPENCDAPMSNLTTTVVWLAEPDTYTVTFDLNGGVATSIPEDIKGVEGTSVVLPETTATKDNYDFIGWAETADATTALSKDYEITKDVTLYAVWAPKQYNYTILNYFMGVDGQYTSPSEETDTAAYGSTVDITNKSYSYYTLDVDNQGNKLSGIVDGDNTLTLTAYYTRNQYTVNYVVAGNTIESATLYYGAVVTPINVPADGNGASGVWVWTKTEDNSPTIEPTTMPAYNLTATADYTGSYATYTVEFYTQSSDGSWSKIDTATKTGRIGDIADETPASIPTGFKLDEESVASGEIKADNSLALTVRLARETYTVTYYVNGNEYETVDYLYGAAVDADAVAVPKDDNDNDGIWAWSTDTGAAPATMPADNLTATAKYPVKVIPAVYKMDVNGNYGESEDGAPVYGDVGNKVTAVVGDVPTGFELDTVKTNLEGTIMDEEGVTDVAIAIYFARKSYTITYKAEGNDDIVKTYLFEAATDEAPAVPTSEGKTGAWDKATPANMPAENLVITAVYETNNYTITYKAEGENDIVKTYAFGANTEPAPAVPEKTGYTGAWDTETPTTMPANDLVITAVYNPNTYTITYKSEMLENDIVKSYEFGANTDPAPEVPAKEGFAGSWDKATPVTMPAEDLVITAIYAENSYKVTYVVDGQEYKVEEYIFGAAIATAPAIPNKIGYSASWVSSDNETYTNMPAKDLTFTAVYTENEYTITYVIDGQETVQTYKYLAEVGEAPALPTVEGRTYRWDKDIPATMPAENLVITAVYNNNTYTITYKVGNDTIAERTYEFGQTITDEAPEITPIEGYNAHWSMETPATMPAENLVIVAMYEKAEFTITYVIGDQQTVKTYVFGDPTDPAPEIPEIEGKTANWSEETPATMPARDMVITAIYENIKYTITYKAEGSEDIVRTYEFGQETESAPTVPAKPYFNGEWDAETPATMPAENLVITAIYTAITYTITYKAEDNEDIVKSYTFGQETEPAPAVPVKEGFDGVWDTETPTTMPAENLVITARYTPKNSGNRVWTASFDNQLVITADADAAKVQICRTVNNELHTWTFVRGDEGVEISTDAETGREIWTISGLTLNEDTYVARARFGDEWTDTEHSVVFEVREERIPKYIISVTPNEKYHGDDNKEIVVVTAGGPDKIQIRREVGEEIHTWTYSRNDKNITINDLGEGKEEWILNVWLAEDNFTMAGKAYDSWDYITPVDFTINYWVPSEEIKVISAEAVDGQEDTYKVVVKGGADKVQFASKISTYTIAKSNSDVTITVDEQDPSIATWIIKTILPEGTTYDINLKRNSDWIMATEDSVKLVVE